MVPPRLRSRGGVEPRNSMERGVRMGAPIKLKLEGLAKRFGSVTAVNHIDLSVEEGTLVSLLGPSGCGKTTTLRMIAGLETPTGGRIVVDGRVLSDERHSAPPEARGMGMVFQNYAVWPHMTVFDNVAYSLKLKRMPRAAIQKKVMDILKAVDMHHYAARHPTQLSGGQQQRVALARALATEPSILLLDEPLSNLDAVLRESMRFEIRNLQQSLGITALYVTHSQEEALALSDVVVVMSQGEILQSASPEEIYRRPRNRFVAGFIGLANLWSVRPIARRGSRQAVALADGSQLWIENSPRSSDHHPFTVMVRPENMKISRTKPHLDDDVPNHLVGQVEGVTFCGSVVDYFVRVNGVEDIVRVQGTPPVAVAKGDEAHLYFAPEDGIVLED